MNLNFIVGTGRCGSSLIHEIISKHSEVGFISNIEDNLPKLNLKGKFNNQLFGTALGSFTTKGRLRFAPSEAYNLISQQVSPIYSHSCRDLTGDDVSPWLQNRFQHFFEVRNSVQAKAVFAHKYTGWSRIGFFDKIFPESKFVHIVRDGRAVANSYLQMPWWAGHRGPEMWLWGELPSHYQEEWLASNKSFVVLAGISWKLLMDSYEQSSKHIDASRYLCIRYEDFLQQPKDSINQILEFMGLHWTPSFDKQFAKQTIFASRSRAYERDLSAAQLKRLQDCLSEKLTQYQYET